MSVKIEEARQVPRGVWALGFVSMFMDISSELIHSLLPVFMVSVLGASALQIGLVEGVAEATALIAKVVSGTLSDYLGKRKGLVLLGYGLGAVSKPFFAVSSTVNAVLATRFMDRIGKGVRGAPRDALVADITPEPIRGAAYGLRQALDTVGAFLGPLAAIALMVHFAGDFRRVFWLAAIPAGVAVLLIVVGVREPESNRKAGEARFPINRQALKELSGEFWKVVILGAVFTLARFSEAFLILRARQQGLPDALAPGVLVLMNVVYAGVAYPAGRLADGMDRRALLAAGLVALIAADVLLAVGGGLAVIAGGVALWGLHMALTQGLLATMVAASAPPRLRGSAFGLFNLACGLSMLAASALAGFLWDTAGPSSTFYAGATISLAALALLILIRGDD